MDQPLAGRTVVVTRASAQASAFVIELESYGAGVIVCPTIEITDPESYERLDEAIDHLYGYDWLILSSINAVDFFLRRLAAHNREVSELDELKVCAIGEATAERLRQAQIHVDVVPVKFKAEGVFAALTQFVGGRERLHGLNLLLPRAAAARDYLISNSTPGESRPGTIKGHACRKCRLHRLYQLVNCQEPGPAF